MIASRVAMLVLGMACVAHAHLGPDPAAGVGFDARPGAMLPLDATFVDAQGASATLGEAFDATPGVLVLGYASCRDLCGTVLPGVAEALDRAGLAAGEDYRAVFASIDAREPPATLAQMARHIPAADRSGWRFLGGNAASVEAVARGVGFRYRHEEARDAFAHAAGFVVVTPEGRVARYFPGVRFDAAALRAALADAREGRTGGLGERLLLLCYHFDPVTGRHSAAILGALRALAAVCVLAAAALAWRMRRRARERAA